MQSYFNRVERVERVELSRNGTAFKFVRAEVYQKTDWIASDSQVIKDLSEMFRSEGFCRLELHNQLVMHCFII